MSSDKKPFWLECVGCAHTWIAAYLPMEVSRFVRLTKGASCPMCGTDKPIIAKQNDGGALREEAS